MVYNPRLDPNIAVSSPVNRTGEVSTLGSSVAGLAAGAVEAVRGVLTNSRENQTESGMNEFLAELSTIPDGANSGAAKNNLVLKYAQKYGAQNASKFADLARNTSQFTVAPTTEERLVKAQTDGFFDRLQKGDPLAIRAYSESNNDPSVAVGNLQRLDVEEADRARKLSDLETSVKTGEASLRQIDTQTALAARQAMGSDELVSNAIANMRGVDNVAVSAEAKAKAEADNVKTVAAYQSYQSIVMPIDRNIDTYLFAVGSDGRSLADKIAAGEDVSGFTSDLDNTVIKLREDYRQSLLKMGIDPASEDGRRKMQYIDDWASSKRALITGSREQVAASIDLRRKISESKADDNIRTFAPDIANLIGPSAAARVIETSLASDPDFTTFVLQGIREVKDAQRGNPVINQAAAELERFNGLGYTPEAQRASTKAFTNASSGIAILDNPADPNQQNFFMRSLETASRAVALNPGGIAPEEVIKLTTGSKVQVFLQQMPADKRLEAQDSLTSILSAGANNEIQTLSGLGSELQSSRRSLGDTITYTPGRGYQVAHESDPIAILTGAPLAGPISTLISSTGRLNPSVSGTGSFTEIAPGAAPDVSPTRRVNFVVFDRNGNFQLSQGRQAEVAQAAAAGARNGNRVFTVENESLFTGLKDEKAYRTQSQQTADRLNRFNRQAEGAGVGDVFRQDVDSYLTKQTVTGAVVTGGLPALGGDLTTEPAAPVSSGVPALPGATQPVQGDMAIDAFVSKTIGVESSGDANAKNPRSSATGLGQFISSTWLDQVKKNRPDLAAGKSDEQILSLRTNGDLSREMTKTYARENAASLQASGVPVTEANLYASHFLGSRGARSVLTSEDSVPLSDLLQASQISANPFLRGWTVGDFKNWASQKMGSAANTIVAVDTSGIQDPGSVDTQPLAEFDKSVRDEFRGSLFDTLPEDVKKAITDGAGAAQDVGQAPTSQINQEAPQQAQETASQSVAQKLSDRAIAQLQSRGLSAESVPQFNSFDELDAAVSAGSVSLGSTVVVAGRLVEV